jgi:mannobiose 2-epimerase
MANRAYEYFTKRFIDKEFGGVFWTVDYAGQPSDKIKRTYAQAFAVYSLAEFYLATGDEDALTQAFKIFNVIEHFCRDKNNDGYFETFERDWTLAADQSLSEVDQNEKKSMNAHLHIMEAYSSLYRASENPQVRGRLQTTYIIHPQKLHLQMYFDEAWTSKSLHNSFGHDIEASWLLCEAAESLGDEDLLEQVHAIALQMAQIVYEKGLDNQGSLLYEAVGCKVIDNDKHWWVQAEAVVGFINAYQLGGREHFLEVAFRVWNFIDRYIIDHNRGEWFWKVSIDDVPSGDKPKLSQWKCPYHNGRMCFEVSRRLSKIEERLTNESHGV